MSIRIGVPKEKTSGEQRVALVPEAVAKLVKGGFEVIVEEGAGEGSYFSDASYEAAGATLAKNSPAFVWEAPLLLKVQPPLEEEIEFLKEGTTLIGLMFPHRFPERVKKLRDRRITTFAMELLPRITRAQAMDVLSSQATVVGYKAVLLAAHTSRRLFPMLTTAAGTIRPAKVLILLDVVAGLQAIATARRLGAIVEAYDVRRTVKEQVESLGARFLEVALDAEAAGGYARELTEEEKKREQEMLARHVIAADAVITTAQIPGRPSPRLISEEMILKMKPGAVIIDLAAEGGGNCAFTQPDQRVEKNGVIILGPTHLSSELSVHASEMYARNLSHFLTLLTQEGKSLNPDWNDEIISGCVLTHQGQIKQEALRKQIEGVSL